MRLYLIILFVCSFSFLKSNEVYLFKNNTHRDSINVKDLGAKGYEGYDNTDIFQFCLDNFKIVYIPEGIYEYTNIVIRKNNVSICGDGKGRTVLKSNKDVNSKHHLSPNIRILSDNSSIIGVTSTYKSMPDFKMSADGRNPINEDANISIGWSEAFDDTGSRVVHNIVVENCEIKGGVVHGIGIGVTENVKILNNDIYNIRGTGIWGYYSNAINVVGNNVYNTGDDGIYIGANGYTKYAPHSRNSDVVIKFNIIKNVSAKGIGLSGCNNAEISFNNINSTYNDGILLSHDNYSGHVSPKNVKVFNNILTNIFGEYGNGYKHMQSAVSELGGYFGMIAIITDEIYSNNNKYQIYNNISEADSRLIYVNGYFGCYIIGNNVEIWNNDFKNGFLGIMIGAPNKPNLIMANMIRLKGNMFSNFKRNAALINASDIIIERNTFGDAEWCITEEYVNKISIDNNYFIDKKKFFLKQTSSNVTINNNYFDDK